jgi:hypothetical protein
MARKGTDDACNADYGHTRSGFTYNSDLRIKIERERGGKEKYISQYVVIYIYSIQCKVFNFKISVLNKIALVLILFCI